MHSASVPWRSEVKILLMLKIESQYRRYNLTDARERLKQRIEQLDEIDTKVIICTNKFLTRSRRARHFETIAQQAPGVSPA